MKQNTKMLLAIAIIVAAIILISSMQTRPDFSQDKKELSLNSTSSRVSAKEKQYQKAIELVSPDGYINTENIDLSQYIGKKVILLDFWTYSCINCQRTLPYLINWHERYNDLGLQIIGIHSPEFDFEKDYENVVKATDKFGIPYPVILDNSFRTWKAYKNRYWPRKYIIDIDGFIVYDHIGEGGYDETEKIIQKLLKERDLVLGINSNIPDDMAEVIADKAGYILTPEIYFGYGFSREQLGNKEGWHPEEVIDYKMPTFIEKNKFYLGGKWINLNDYMESNSDSSIVIKYFAKNINIVAGSDAGTEINIYNDEKFVKKLMIKDFDLYNLVSSDGSEEHTLRIETGKGLKAYTFTFG